LPYPSEISIWQVNPAHFLLASFPCVFPGSKEMLPLNIHLPRHSWLEKGIIVAFLAIFLHQHQGQGL